jgi:hypothetical protein
LAGRRDDTARNEAWVSVGVDHDTAEFAVATLERWWREMGKKDKRNTKSARASQPTPCEPSDSKGRSFAAIGTTPFEPKRGTGNMDRAPSVSFGAFKDELAPFKFAKGRTRFPICQPVPEALRNPVAWVAS